MIKNIVKLLASALILILVVTPTLGEEEQNNIMLNTLMENIAEISYDAQKVILEEKKYQYDYDEAVINRNNYKGGASLENKLNQKYYFDQAKMSLDYAVWNKEQVIGQVKLDGTEQYFEYLFKLDEIAVQEDEVESLKLDVVNTEKRISLGLSVASDLEKTKLALEKGEFQLSLLKNELTEITYNLNNYLMWDLEKTINVLSVSVPEVNIEKINLEDIIETSLASHGDIIKSQQSLELTKTYIKALEDADYNKEDNDYLDALADRNLAALEADDMERTVRFNLYSDYNDVISSEQTMHIKEMELENASIQGEIIQKRYDVGLETEATLKEVQRNESRAEIAYKRAKLELYLQYTRFLNIYQ